MLPIFGPTRCYRYPDGAVWINPAQISELRTVNHLRWALRRGDPVPFPPPALIIAQEALAGVG